MVGGRALWSAAACRRFPFPRSANRMLDAFPCPDAGALPGLRPVPDGAIMIVEVIQSNKLLYKMSIFVVAAACMQGERNCIRSPREEVSPCAEASFSLRESATRTLSTRAKACGYRFLLQKLLRRTGQAANQV